MKNKINYYDVHAHTNIEPLLNNSDKIIDICQNEKTIFNCIGTNVANSLIACQQAKKYPNKIFATVGIHPDECNNFTDIKKIEEIYLKNQNVIVAIGEVGLDYHNKKTDKSTQKKFLNEFIKIVNKYNLPICIHVRDADEDCLKILQNVKNKNKIWIHCFSKNVEIAKKYLSLGCYFSFSGIITFKNSKELHEAIEIIPINRIMVETDAPFLTPDPHRGKTNFPYYVKYIIEQIAQIKKINIKKICEQIMNNSLTFFNIKNKI